MAVVVVGGHTRNIGKSSVVAGLIAALPQMRWTAFKITQFGHGVCSANGRPCDCETADHTLAISEERGLDVTTDSGRFLAAGAVRSLWVRTRQGQLFEAMSRIRREMEGAENVIFESNSILQFVRPDLYLTVLDPGVQDFKVSARRFLDRADAIVTPCPASDELVDTWADVGRSLVQGRRCFRVRPPIYVSEELSHFVSERVRSSGHKNPPGGAREVHPITGR